MSYWIYTARQRSIVASLILALVTTCALAQTSPRPDLKSLGTTQPIAPKALRTITTVHEAHSLSADEARRGYPVHFRATVTYLDHSIDRRRIALYLHDSTGSMYAAVALGTTWQGRQPVAGTLVDVTGISSPGDYAPIIGDAHIVVLGNSHLPTAKPMTLTQLLTGAEAGQWIEIEGVVHSVLQSGTHINLQVAMREGNITATTIRQPGVDYQQLVDKWVHIRGNAGTTFNENRQLTNVRLFFPDLGTVSASTPDSGDAFSRPVRLVNGLLRFDPLNQWPHRVHVRGTATLYWPGMTICIQDSTGGLCAQTTQSTPLAIGSSVDLIGFAILRGFKPALADATFQPLAGRAPIVPIPVTPQQALKGNFDSNLVQIEGKLIGYDLATNDTGLILASGNSVFHAFLPASSSDAKSAAIKNGSRLRVSGICSVEVDNLGTLKGFGFTSGSRFSILLTSPRDIVVLENPSWWTADRIGFALLFSLAITIAGFGWIFVLRRRVEQKTRELRESRELYRHMAHHDALTGLPTRILLHDHLQASLERYRRFKKGVALLMLDLDNFKHINDSHGHGCGDHVLCITADRISAIIRKTDSIARMGGDEFIVLLNDLVNPGRAEMVAAKIVAALARPMRIGKLEVTISVSVGVCTLSDATVDADVLLSRVDAAMYRAKASGRGCFQVFTDNLIDTSRSQLPGAPAIAARKDEQDRQNAPTSETVAL